MWEEAYSGHKETIKSPEKSNKGGYPERPENKKQKTDLK
jgi:hypothetical protein